MKRKWFFRALALFFVGGIFWLLIGVTINFPPKSPQQKLNEARALWQTKGSKDYQMDFSFGSFSFIGGYRIVVHDNQVTNIISLPFYSPDLNHNLPDLNAKPLDAAQQTLDQSNYFAQAISPDLKDYSVGGLFDIAAPKMSNYSPLVTWCNVDTPFPDIHFNSEYGYIESYDLGNCAKWEFGGGMLCSVLPDCNASMKVSNFEILPTS